MKVIDLDTGIVHEWDDYVVHERGLPDYGNYRLLDDLTKEELAAMLAYALQTGGRCMPVVRVPEGRPQ